MFHDSRATPDQAKPIIEERALATSVGGGADQITTHPVLHSHHISMPIKDDLTSSGVNSSSTSSSSASPSSLCAGQATHPPSTPPEFVIVLCIRYALGWQYYKYTLDGVNIIFINFLGLVAFTLCDFYVIGPANGYTGIASHSVIFGFALLSVIPLGRLIN